MWIGVDMWRKFQAFQCLHPSKGAFCRKFCKSAGLRKAIDASSDFASRVSVEAFLLLNIFILDRCRRQASIEKYNTTFFFDLCELMNGMNSLINAVG